MSENRKVSLEKKPCGLQTWKDAGTGGWCALSRAARKHSHRATGRLVPAGVWRVFVIAHQENRSCDNPGPQLNSKRLQFVDSRGCLCLESEYWLVLPNSIYQRHHYQSAGKIRFPWEFWKPASLQALQRSSLHAVPSTCWPRHQGLLSRGAPGLRVWGGEAVHTSLRHHLGISVRACGLLSFAVGEHIKMLMSKFNHPFSCSQVFGVSRFEVWQCCQELLCLHLPGPCCEDFSRACAWGRSCCL